MEFLKANGIEDPGLMKEIDYQDVLNQQEIYGEELNLFANKEMHKEVSRVDMVRENYLKFFPGQGKVREFSGWPEKFRKDLESQGKVRELKNKWLWEAVFTKFIYSFPGEKMYFLRGSLNPSPSSLGATLKGKK